MKSIPTIEKYMTPMPHTVGVDIDVTRAYEMMKEGNYRHLPVQDAGKLVGVLTDRDVKFGSSFKSENSLTVEDLMTQDPYTTTPEAKLDEVVTEMAEKKIGCAIVQQANGKVVGIFTGIDALQTLAEILNKRFKR